MVFFDREIKKLGFGLMRLPKRDEAIDLEQVKDMVDAFMAAGFTYFDTAWAYNGSEEAIRKALVERYPRESFQLATKNAAWLRCEIREDAARQFEDSLERTGAGYFDNYLLHNLGGDRTHFFDDFGMWDFVKEKKAEGRIRHIGFSFHSTPEELERLLSAHPEVEFVQLQINYADWEDDSVQSRAVYETARRFGKPVVIMEPVKGGLLADPPESVARVMRRAELGSSPASWALRFAADLPGVLVVLSGMSSLAQMEDNISVMRDFVSLAPEQRETIAEVRRELDAIELIPCTKCDYCAKVCPMEIGISGTFRAKNIYTRFGNLEQARRQEDWQVGRQGRRQAVNCIGCGSCEQVCPQHIAIRSELSAAAELFGQKKEEK